MALAVTLLVPIPVGQYQMHQLSSSKKLLKLSTTGYCCNLLLLLYSSITLPLLFSFSKYPLQHSQDVLALYLTFVLFRLILLFKKNRHQVFFVSWMKMKNGGVCTIVRYM